MVVGLWAFGSAIVSFIVTAVAGKFLIPYLHKLHFGQTILDIGPSWHKNKQGTPTMGGIMFIIGIVFTTILGVVLHAVFSPEGFTSTEKFIFIGLGMAFVYGFIGFLDDYISVVKKRNLGLTAIQKLGLQFVVAVVYLVIMAICGDDTKIGIPFAGLVDLHFFYYIIMAIVIVGFVNAVNLTDGIDGLVGSITFFVALFFMLIANVLAFTGNVIFAAAVAGGCLGFLVWNFHPAKVFMGDTGSLFLGGIVCAVAFAMDMHIILIIVGLVYLIEMFSVMLQVSYFKITHGKRIFKMTPIHHHFEMSGWSETKIVVIFSLTTALLGVVSLLLVIFG